LFINILFLAVTGPPGMTEKKCLNGNGVPLPYKLKHACEDLTDKM
jgi:hypothetical protein